jgi:hypothetical protein
VRKQQPRLTSPQQIQAAELTELHTAESLHAQAADVLSHARRIEAAARKRLDTARGRMIRSVKG